MSIFYITKTNQFCSVHPGYKRKQGTEEKKTCRREGPNEVERADKNHCLILRMGNGEVTVVAGKNTTKEGRVFVLF